MKAIKSLSISVIILTACSGCKSSVSDGKKQAETTVKHPIKKEKIYLHPNLSTSQNLNFSVKMYNFPFGSDILATYKFPKTWVNNNESDSVRNINNEMQNKLLDFYNKLNTVKGLVALPFIKYTPVKLSYPWKFDSRLIYRISHLKYRLPSIGPYDCYYIYGDAPDQYLIKEKKGIDYENRNPTWREAGNLVLFNLITKVTKLLNIYISVSAPFLGYGRYFYISKDKKIHLYDFETDEEDTTFVEKYVISISDDGEIEVIENK